jgi:hypothetical protein
MRAVGEGHDLWRVEVVLRTREPGSAQVQELLHAVAASTSTRDEDEHSVLPDVEQAWSHDIQPPEGGVGVACWVRSDTVGDAAERGWSVVRDAAAATLGAEARLWDLRVIPRVAILEAPSAGTPLMR